MDLDTATNRYHCFLRHGIIWQSDVMLRESKLYSKGRWFRVTRLELPHRYSRVFRSYHRAQGPEFSFLHKGRILGMKEE